MRLAGVGLLLLSGVTLAGQPPSSVDRPPPPPPGTAPLAIGSGTIRGRVVAAATHDPVRHARITIRSSAGRAPTALTDESGGFVVSTLPPGHFTVTATKPGYAKTTAEVSLTGSSVAETGELTLVKGAMITGTIVDEFGDPVVDVSVAAQRLETIEGVLRPRPVAIAQTDDTGVYRFSGLPPDTYVVDVTPTMLRSIDDSGRVTSGFFGPDARENRVYFPGVSSLEAAQRVAVQSGDEKTGLTFTVPAAAVDPFIGAGSQDGAHDEKTSAFVRGRVTRPGGSPAARARVVAASVDAPRPIATTTTDEAGAYVLEIPEPGAGRYRITARKSSPVATPFGARAGLPRGELVAVRPGETRRRIDITLQPPAVIAGRVVDDLGEPIEGVVVRASEMRFVDGGPRLVDNPLARRTDDLGRYRLYGLRPGRYAISAAPGEVGVFQASPDLPGYGVTFFPGTTDTALLQLVTVAGGAEVGDIDFALARTRSFRVSGQASEALGNPVTGGIALMPTRRSGAMLTTQLGARIEPDGRFEFANVTPGDYVLQVSRGRKSMWTEGEFVATFVTVADRDVTGLIMRTSLGSSIEGRVTFVGGEPPPPDRIELSALPVDPDLTPQIGGPPAKARIEADGRFELVGISGPRRLQVVREPPGWTTKAIYSRGVDITDQPLPFGRDEQSLHEVEVTLTNRVARILGSFSNAADLAGRDIGVVAFPVRPELRYDGTRFLKRTSPRADASFSLDAMPPEDYFVVAADVPENPGEWRDPDVLERLSRGATRVRVVEGESASVTLRVPR